MIIKYKPLIFASTKINKMKKLVLFLTLILINLSLFARGSSGGGSHCSSGGHSSFGGSHSSMSEHSMSEHSMSENEAISSHPSSSHSMEEENPYHNFQHYYTSDIQNNNNYYYYRIYNENTKHYDTITDNTEDGLKTKLDQIQEKSDNNTFIVCMIVLVVIVIILGIALI